jgi:hypothetical protein
MKMKHILIISLLCLLPFFLNAQYIWKKSDYSLPYGSLARDVAEAYDGGYLIGGLIRNLEYPFFGYIVKTDINGGKLWHKVIDGQKASIFYTTNITSDGGFVAGGLYNTHDDHEDAYIMKFNSCAEPEWCFIFPVPNGNPSQIVSGIHQLPEGGYICERYEPVGENYNSLSLIKLKSNGAVDWINYYDINHDWTAQIDWRLNLTSDSCFLLNGLVYDTVFFEYGGMCNLPFWYKVDNDGNLLWERKWDLTEAQFAGEARKVIEDNNNSYYSGGSMLPPVGQSFLFKLSKSGDTIASYRVMDHPNSLGGTVQTLNLLNDTTLLIGTQFGLTNEDNWWSLNLTDTIGHIKKAKVEEEQVIFAKSLVTNDNKILQLVVLFSQNSNFPYNWIGLYKFNTNLEYDSIYTMPRTYDSLCPYPIVSDTIPMPGICTFVSLPEPVNKSDELQLKVYPNPASEYVTIEIPEYSVTTTKGGYVTQQQFRPLTGDVQLSIINLSGQIVKTEVFDASERNHVITVNMLTPGLYMLHLTQKGKFVAQGKVMVVR